MNKLIRVLPLALLLAACADGGPDPGFSEADVSVPGRMCVDRTEGTYRIDTKELSGTCGEMGGITVQLPAPADASQVGCKVFQDISNDNCVVDTDNQCPTSRLVSHLRWSYDGTSATARSTFTNYRDDGKLDCKSTYEITWTKLD